MPTPATRPPTGLLLPLTFKVRIKLKVKADDVDELPPICRCCVLLVHTGQGQQATPSRKKTKADDDGRTRQKKE
jgi:hypothetical protein